jgi:hypothetical protein
MSRHALTAAKKENKHVMLIFTQPGNIWCELFDKFHSDPEVQQVLGQHFILGRLDLNETPGGFQMYLEHPPRNVPGFAILDFHGAIVSDSGEGDQNFGFPNNPDQVDRYIAALKTAQPKLGDDDCAVLRSKLEQLRTDAQP